TADSYSTVNLPLVFPLRGAFFSSLDAPENITATPNKKPMTDARFNMPHYFSLVGSFFCVSLLVHPTNDNHAPDADGSRCAGVSPAAGESAATPHSSASHGVNPPRVARWAPQAARLTPPIITDPSAGGYSNPAADLFTA